MKFSLYKFDFQTIIYIFFYQKIKICMASTGFKIGVGIVIFIFIWESFDTLDPLEYGLKCNSISKKCDNT